MKWRIEYSIEQTDKTELFFSFEKINKIEKPSARPIKKIREKTQLNQIRYERDVTTDITEV